MTDVVLRRGRRGGRRFGGGFCVGTHRRPGAMLGDATAEAERLGVTVHPHLRGGPRQRGDQRPREIARGAASIGLAPRGAGPMKRPAAPNPSRSPASAS